MPRWIPRFRPLRRNPEPTYRDWQWSGTLSNGVYVVVSYVGLGGARDRHPGKPWEVEVTSAPTSIHSFTTTRLLYYATAREVRACIKRSGYVKAERIDDHQPISTKIDLRGKR